METGETVGRQYGEDRDATGQQDGEKTGGQYKKEES